MQCKTLFILSLRVICLFQNTSAFFLGLYFIVCLGDQYSLMSSLTQLSHFGNSLFYKL
uniref:Uncharacterized protein n=1 Tax=Rhizophora mucronata TaxID=61149 RepID=A0A2P2PIC9_RHIMU